jgi:multidrug efflux system outer membrane protein
MKLRTMSKTLFSRRLLLVSALTVMLTACATSKQDSIALQLAQSAAPAFQVPQTAVQQFNDGEVVAAWWENFQDARLTELVDDALRHNHDVGIALANLELARTQLRDSELDYLPSVDVAVTAGDQRIANMPGLPGAGARFTRYEAGFDTQWELDLFGRIRQGVNAAEADLAATGADLDAVYVSVAAEVARSYLGLRGVQYRLDIARRHVGNLEQSLQLTQRLLDGGLGNALDVQRAQAQLQLVQASLPALQAQADVLINRLSVLSGRMPATLREALVTAQPLPSLTPTLDVGEPLALLQRRPDIRRAEHQLTAAAARYDLRVAELYPRISISGTLGFLATKFADLGTGGTFNHLIGPGISWELFNRERLHNRVDAADAQVHRQLEMFEQTLLTSFEEVDNAMSSLSHEGERRDSLFAAADASARAAGLARDRFDAGADSFLDVLDAQRTQLDAEDLLAQSETQLALQHVALYKALGGGWEVTQAR